MRKVFYILLFSCFVACEEAQPELEILKETDRVVDILSDMYIAEATLNKQNILVRDSLANVYREKIILIHTLTEDEFDTLFWLIQTDMENYGDVHKKVVDQLNTMNEINNNE